ncbi:Hsp20/alpha crystallin family protein [Desulfarculales bacterium]
MTLSIQVMGADALGARIRQMINRMTRLEHGDPAGGWSPPVDIYETTEAVVLVAEVAGVIRQEVKVIVDGPLVRLYGHRYPICCDPGARFHRMEISSGGFTRSFRIDVPFKAEAVHAKFQEGLLYVFLPKDLTSAS